MRTFFKAIAIGLLACTALMSASSMAQAAPTGPSTSWNNGQSVRYGASLFGRPPGGVAHRVSVTDADYFSLARPGDAETYAIDAADLDYTLDTLFPSGTVGLYTIGSSDTVAIGSNSHGTVWNATVYAYVKDGGFLSTHGTVCSFSYSVTPLGELSVETNQLAPKACTTY